MTEPEPSQPKSNGYRALLLMLGIILACVALGFSGFCWWQFHNIQHSTKNLTANFATLQNKYATFNQNIENLQNSIDEIGKQNHATNSNEIVALLIRLANIYYKEKRDLTASIELLKTAKTFIAHDAENYLNLEQAVNNDIENLQKLSNTQSTAIKEKIDFLIEQIEQLPTMVKLHPLPQMNTSKEEDQKTSLWERIKYNLSGLKSLFIIQKSDEDIVPVLEPQHILLWRDIIAFKLMQAQWAALHYDFADYQQNLSTAKRWISRYLPQQPELDQITKQLQDLMTALPVNENTQDLNSFKELQNINERQTT